MEGVIVGELSKEQFGMPVVLEVVDIDLEVLLKGLIDLLSLSIGLQVVHGGKVGSDAEGLT